jgi:serine/threonine protein kinase/tetratricopeptide (TPR) repeat protein
MNEESLFAEALGKKGDARAAFLDKHCKEDAELRKRLETLLRAADYPDPFLEAPVPAPVATVDEVPVTEHSGAMIGPYKLLEQIGEGGMGSVWMARQAEPVKRLVAIKFIKAGMDSRQVIARFEAERQALALMEHPSIARVLDGGTSSVGRPYFVMDLVKGVSITKYCDEHHLTPRKRLELFIPVCQAVQHAHQKGIVHRDIKPSNVLVALYDGMPVPKVIDFGVAKAAGQQLTDKTLVTGFGNIVGTLEYMSPEQAEINQLDIDTRSDIYSLGVLLYELLAGSPPFTRKELEKAGMMEMLRVIREQEPSKPSTKLSTAEGLPTLAANRGTEPAKLTKLLRGELDWIVMKALEKDRSRRYETANGLVRDIERYMSDEPVQAGPPTAGYRLRRFVRRNKRGVLAAGLVVLALVGGIIGTTAGLIRAGKAHLAEAKQRQLSEENFRLARQAVDKYFTKVSESKQLKARGLEKLREELLQQAKTYYEEFLDTQGDNPTLRSDLGKTHILLTKINEAMGKFPAAEAHAEKAIAIFEGLISDHPDVVAYQLDIAWSWYRLAKSRWHTGGMEEAEKALLTAKVAFDKLVRGYPDTRGEYREGLGFCYNDLAVLCFDSGRKDEAELAYQQALSWKEELVREHGHIPEYHESLAITHFNLGEIYLEAGRSAQAESHLQKAMAIIEKVSREYPDKPEYQNVLAATLVSLGRAYGIAGRADKAEQALLSAVNIQGKAAREHPDVVNFAIGLADSYLALGESHANQKNLDMSQTWFEKAVWTLREILQKEPRNGEARELLNDGILGRAALLAARGNYTSALKEVDDVARLQRLSANNLYNLACVYSQASKAVSNTSQVSASQRSPLSKQYGERAMEFLRQAVSKGLRNVTRIKQDARLEPLRDRGDFEKMIHELEEGAKK